MTVQRAVYIAPFATQCHSCPVDPALSFALFVLSSMVSVCLYIVCCVPIMDGLGHTSQLCCLSYLSYTIHHLPVTCVTLFTVCAFHLFGLIMCSLSSRAPPHGKLAGKWHKGVLVIYASTTVLYVFGLWTYIVIITIIRPNFSSKSLLTSCHVSCRVVLCQLPVVGHWFTALHASCVSVRWPVCLHWTWYILCVSPRMHIHP